VPPPPLASTNATAFLSSVALLYDGFYHQMGGLLQLGGPDEPREGPPLQVRAGGRAGAAPSDVSASNRRPLPPAESQLLFCGRSGQNRGLSGGDPPNLPSGRRGRTCARRGCSRRGCSRRGCSRRGCSRRGCSRASPPAPNYPLF
jgi:hypothetical protein